ncbi:hypothetical protein SCB49_13965 [unidentified eubacterium SCB49]|nr:hypothetical protein SCB49_13965 [unidentified eubacterium SCB49]
MQTILTYFSLLFAGFLSAQTSITVTITDFDSNKGNAMIALYSNEANFLGDPDMGAIKEITNNSATVTFNDIPEGVYAISVFHDENDNKKFDMILGMLPKEDYVNSNYAEGTFGPPQWEDAKFVLKDKPLAITLKMNN